jgi:hypothetical protein
MRDDQDARPAREYIDEVTIEPGAGPQARVPEQRTLERSASAEMIATLVEAFATPRLESGMTVGLVQQLISQLSPEQCADVLPTALIPQVLDLMSPPQLVACLTPSRTGEEKPRACLRILPIGKLCELLKNPTLTDGLARLVPLLKVSSVIPCLQAPGMVERLLPWLDPSQCKLLGPELATLIAPHLHLNWTQLDHLPLETVVLVPTETFWTLPIKVLKHLPAAHRQYLAPYVKGARKVNHDDHELALCQGLCQILHLHTHKVLDPEHIPGAPQLRALQRDRSLRAKIQELRWQVDAVMAASVEAVQLGSLKLTTLNVALRKVGVTALADELEIWLQRNKHARGWLHGAGGVAYTRDLAIAVQHAQIGEADLFAESQRTGGRGHTARTVKPLADALSDAFHRHAGPAAWSHGHSEQHPLPTRRYAAVISLELAAAYPPDRANEWQALEAVLHEQLGEPCNRVTIQEVHLRWADATTAVYRRHGDGRYRRW